MTNLHTTTTERFIAFYYGECDLFEKLELDFFLSENLNANKQYASISDQLQELNSISLSSPSKNSIESILAYSRSKIA